MRFAIASSDRPCPCSFSFSASSSAAMAARSSSSRAFTLASMPACRSCRCRSMSARRPWMESISRFFASRAASACFFSSAISRPSAVAAVPSSFAIRVSPR